MSYDYDRLYATTPDALGPPTRALVDVFEGLTATGLSVLDVGCGQGRDALFIARLGHRVHGVDLAPHGIRDLLAAARAEGLAITGEVADLVDYAPMDRYDIVLIDRTLHMLGEGDRLRVLERLLDCVSEGGWCLIADERSNMPDFMRVIKKHPARWKAGSARRGYLFCQRL